VPGFWEWFTSSESLKPCVDGSVIKVWALYMKLKWELSGIVVSMFWYHKLMQEGMVGGQREERDMNETRTCSLYSLDHTCHSSERKCVDLQLADATWQWVCDFSLISVSSAILGLI
jgi:hypothetical protein